MGLDISHSIPTNFSNDTLDYFTLDELKENQAFIEKYKHLITEIESEEGSTTKVIYFKEKGYLRKSMNKEFINNFTNNKVYFDLDSVKKAYGFLETKNGENLADLKDLFEKKFIDNFVEGESIFWVCW